MYCRSGHYFSWVASLLCLSGRKLLLMISSSHLLLTGVRREEEGRMRWKLSFVLLLSPFTSYTKHLFPSSVSCLLPSFPVFYFSSCRDVHIQFLLPWSASFDIVFLLVGPFISQVIWLGRSVISFLIPPFTNRIDHKVASHLNFTLRDVYVCVCCDNERDASSVGIGRDMVRWLLILVLCRDWHFVSFETLNGVDKNEMERDESRRKRWRHGKDLLLLQRRRM